MRFGPKLVALAISACCGVAQAATFDPATGYLTIPSIKVGGVTYSVVVSIGSLVSFNTGVPGSEDSYEPTTNVLSMPSIVVGGIAFTNVKVTVGGVISFSVVSTTPPASAASCSAASAPAGFNYSQSGNTITVTTNGCVALPTTGICNPTATQATGVNVLVTQNTQSFKLTGIVMNIPGLPNPFDAMASALGVTSSCIRNAPTGYSSLTVNSNVCYDITQQMGPALTANPSPYITVSNPITMSMQGTTTMQVVADCLTSGAMVITDALTGTTLIKQADGSYK